KNYPVAVPLVADAQAALDDLLAALGPGGGPGTYRDTPYFAEAQRLKADWMAQVEVKSASDRVPMTQARAIREVQRATADDAPVCVVVLDNSGWISIKGGQQAFFGRTAATDFVRRDGSVYSPDFAAIGRAFGIQAETVNDPGDVCPAIARALGSGGPSLVAIGVSRDLADAGADKTGWWDVPVPEYHPAERAAQLAGRAQEQHL